MGFTTIILTVIWTTSVVDCILEGRKDPNTCCDKLNNSTFPDDCFETFLWAGEDEKYAYTPNFPNQFPIQKKCVWGIYARPGKRVRLEFRDFYLIGPGDDGICYSQGVLIKSPLSSLTAGPHCGNAGLPTVVSDGNYLVVELLSNIPMTTENFRGFKMSFVETDETPSPQLRPPNWGNDDLITVDPNVLAKKFPAFTRKPTRKVTKTTRIPSRFRPTVRPISLLPPVITRFNFETPSGIEGGTGKKSVNSAGKSLLLEEIVGIAVGGVVFTGIIVVIALKLRQRKRPETKELGDKGDGTKKAAETKIEIEMDKVNDLSTQNQNFLPGYYVYYFHQPHQSKTGASQQKSTISNQNTKVSKHSTNRKRRKHGRTKAISLPVDDCKPAGHRDNNKTTKKRAERRKIPGSKTVDTSTQPKEAAKAAEKKSEPKRSSNRREINGDIRPTRSSRRNKRKTRVEKSKNVTTKNRATKRRSHRA